MSAKVFFRKRQELFVIVGWLIIVATFITKDVFRENLNDVADSISAAETLYLLRDDNLKLHQEIDDVDADLLRVETDILMFQRRAPKAKREKYVSSASFHRNSDRVLRIQSEMFLEVDNLARLVAKAPPDAEHMKQFTELYQEWDALKMNMLKEDSVELKVPLEKFDSEASDSRSIKEYGEIRLLSQQLHLVGAIILDQAHEMKERKENLVNIFTPISYILWGLGALLALGSKLFGSESTVEMD